LTAANAGLIFFPINIIDFVPRSKRLKLFFVIYDTQHGRIDNGFGILRDYSYKPKKVVEKEKRRTSERFYGSRVDILGPSSRCSGKTTKFLQDFSLQNSIINITYKQH